MLNDKKHNRRFFLKTALAAVSIGFVGLWDKMASRNSFIKKVKTINFPLDFNKKINFSNDYIIIRSGDDFKVFASACTHLGCRINHSSDDKLICPCHGSTFNLDGQAIKGPALNSLQSKDFIIDETNKTITITC